MSRPWSAVGVRIRKALVEAMRLLYERGLVNLRGGNASALLALPDGTSFIYITPSGRPKHQLSPSDIAVMTPDGRVVEGRPSSEYRLHLAVYRARPDARAVVHAHTPLALGVGYEALTRLFEWSVEARYYVGSCLGRVERAEPGTEELAEKTAKALQGGCNAALLEGHGSVAVGVSEDPVDAVYEAVDRLEALEDIAKTAIASRLSGGGSTGPQPG